MTANLFGERFAGFRKPAWHGLGTVFNDELTAVEAVELAKCDYSVFKSPLSAQIHNTWTDKGKNQGTTRFTIPGQFAVTRERVEDDDNFRFFGFVSEDYEILDNLEIARALDTLTDTWRVDTVGALDDGKILFIALDAGEIELTKGGETVHNYFLFTDRKDGRQKARFSFTPVRVVCQNTLVMGERQSRVNAEIEHRSGASQALQFRVDIVDKLLKRKELSIETLQAMASVQLTNKQAASIISSAYPMPKKSPDIEFAEDEKLLKSIGDGSLADELFTIATRKKNLFEYQNERYTSYREFATTLYDKINDEYPDIARTPWAAYNAVVEAADYREGRGEVDYSSLFGTRAKEKVLAYNTAERVTATLLK